MHKIWLIVFICLFGYAPLVIAKRIQVQGTVFFDSNQNGVRELSEIGLGGIQVLVNMEKVLYTDEHGSFQDQIDVEDNFATLSINEQFVPAGSRLTTSPSQIINDANVNYSNLVFGIYYAEVTHRFPKKNDKQNNTKSDGYTFTFQIEDHKVLINQVPVFAFSESAASPVQENLKIPSSEMTVIQSKEFLAYLKKLKSFSNNFVLKDLKIKVSKSIENIKNTEAIEELARLIEIEIQKNIKISRAEKDFSFEEDKIEVSAFLGMKNPNKCRVYHNATTFEVSSKPISLNIGSALNTNFEIDCPEKFKSIDINILDEKFFAKVDKKTVSGDVSIVNNVKENQKPSKSWLELSEGKYLEKNRDRWAQFVLKSSGLKSYTINGKVVKNTTDGQVYLHKGEPGKNTLNISMQDYDGHERVSKHEFKLQDQRKFYFSTTLDTYDLKSQSSKFNFNYDIPTERRLNVDALYFFQKSLGVHFNHIEDISGSTTELTGGGETTYKRKENQLHGIYRFKILHQGYYAPVLQLYGGVQMKQAGLPKDSVFHFPEDFNGLSVGAELYKENFLTTQIENSTAFFAAMDGDQKTYRFIQELRFNLNYLGKLFRQKAHYIYGPTYTGWNNSRLVVGINYEIDKRNAENADAVIEDTLVAYRIGLAFQF